MVEFKGEKKNRGKVKRGAVEDMQDKVGKRQEWDKAVYLCLTLCQWVEPGSQAPGGSEVVVGVQRSNSCPLVLHGILEVQA